jgi:hypothetical protein
MPVSAVAAMKPIADSRVEEPARFRCFIRRDQPMVITTAHLSPIISIIAGIAILLVPRLLNYIVAIYLIVIGVIGLGFVHI